MSGLKNRWMEYIGVVVVPIKERNQRIIRVFVPELVPGSTGTIEEDNEEIVKISVKSNKKNKENRAVLKLTNSIEAVYIGYDAQNDIPDVHIGEQVKILYYEADDTYYWAALERDRHLRKTEHYRISCADKKKVNEKLSDDNNYYAEIDTKYHKHVHIHTSKSDDEKFGYDIKIDCEKSEINVTDNDGNYFILKSPEQYIKMKNKDDSLIELDKKVLNLSSVDTINISSNDININSKNNTTITAANELNENSFKHTIKNTAYTLISQDTLMNLIKLALNSTTGSVTFSSGEILVSGITHTKHVHVSSKPGENTSPPKN